MQIPKPTDEVKAFFRSVVPDSAGVEIRPMFGNLGAFVNGNMFAGLFGPAIGIRLLDPDTVAELQAFEGTAPFGPAERPMGGYIALPAEWMSAPARVTEWMRVALTQVAALPAKQPTARAKK
jgi:TfoX/Sxy family transcriptional regulator of competence genes